MILQMKRFSFLWLGLALISLIATIFFYYNYAHTKNYYIDQARLNAKEITANASKALDRFILELKPLAEKLVKKLQLNYLTPEQIETILIENKPVEITSVGVAYKPYKLHPKQKLFARNFIEQSGKQNMIDIAQLYDYTTHDWFKETNKPAFYEPYYGTSSKTVVAEYRTPFSFKGEREPAGVVFANQSVEHLQHILDTLFLGKNGYWFIITDKGTFLAHPQSKYIHKGATIFDVAKDLENSELAQVAKKIIQGEKQFFEYDNEITGAPSWLISENIQGTPWSLVGVFDKNELESDPNVLRQKLIYPSISFLLFIISFVFFIGSLADYTKLFWWWFTSLGISFGFLIQILWTWTAVRIYPIEHRKNLEIVENKVQLYTYLEKERTVYKYGKKVSPEKQTVDEYTSIDELLSRGFMQENYIPTGLFINDLKFTEADQIEISAYVWQQYILGIQDDISRGFILPQASDPTINEISRFKGAKTETIIWELYAKINQFLDYTRYPFDSKSLRIKFWPKYTKSNVAFVPDLDSYQLINPRSLPGINLDAYIPGWNIDATYFGYEKSNITTNFGSYSTGPFGVYEEVDISERPQFYFEIVTSRKLIDALISDLLPVVVIAVLLFIILLLSAERNMSFISWVASVFFATIFAQIRFRSKIPHAQIVYFESLYFLLYVIILAVLASCVITQFQFNVPFIQYRKNLISKVIYWPFFFGTFALVTLYYLW